MEAVEAIGQVVEQRALGLDHPGEGVHQPLGVVAGVGARALGEEDVDERARALALGRGGERRCRQLVGGETGVRGATKHLGDDARKGLVAASLRRPVRDMRARAVTARDVPGIGQPSVDGPDRVRVDAQRGAELADRGEARAREQPTGIDLVGQLPVDLGRDRDVRIALDVERAPGGHGHGSLGGQFVC